MDWTTQFNTYQEACDYYGCDGPAQFAAEAAYEAEMWAIEKAALEAEYGPYIEAPFNVGDKFAYRFDGLPADDEIPF